VPDSLRPEEHDRRVEEIDGLPVGITTYRIDATWYCKVDNVEPGVMIARAEGATRKAAETEAIEKARARLATTQKMKDSLRDLRASVAQLDERLKSRVGRDGDD
jgi:hypothetical protein